MNIFKLRFIGVLGHLRPFVPIRFQCLSAKMKVLNVAEKNDAAKTLAGFMSSNIKRREGCSKFNKIYEFEHMLFGQKCDMIMTSVSGHLLGLEFVGAYRNWRSCSPLSLFDAPLTKQCISGYEEVKRTIEREVKKCSILIIWTDCDREGENIGFEIIQVCTAVKPNIKVYRAKFSEITYQSVRRAIQNLAQPDKRISDAVEVRQELDLRIGAAFTRFQTLRLQKVFPQSLSDALISYGSCQFPTLGFVVERYKSIAKFVPEQFWKIKVNHTIGDLSVEFAWERGRLFDQLACQVLLDICLENPTATVLSVLSKPKSKWRPLPLDTVELEKLGSRKLKMNAKEVMKIAEKLYTQGFISYPRTETNIFPKELDLANLVGIQTSDPLWGVFANRVLQDGPNPRQGKKSDQAHPPIHPIKYTASLSGNEQKLYEFVVRHFLACCSKDAEGHETIVQIDINQEKFVATGLMIIAKNYLEVYPYEKWNAKEIHIYTQGQTFQPSIEMSDGSTNAPKLLTEADLIALMEKHGIGTDATHADHIETIKARLYVGLENEKYFVPGHLGMGLVEGYDSMGFPMSKPNLRAELEADLQKICEGKKDPKIVLQGQLVKYKEVFQVALEQAMKIDEALARYFQEQPAVVESSTASMPETLAPVMKCVSCGSDMVLRTKRDGNGKFISCMGFPDCRNAIWFPSNVISAETLSESCQECGPSVKKIKFNFRRGSYTPFLPDEYVGCIGGCDGDFLQMLDININSVRRRTSNQQTTRMPNDQGLNDSGFGSSDIDNAVNIIQQSQSHWSNSRGMDMNNFMMPSNTMNSSQISRNTRGRGSAPNSRGTTHSTRGAGGSTARGRGQNAARGRGRGRGSGPSTQTSLNSLTSSYPNTNRLLNTTNNSSSGESMNHSSFPHSNETSEADENIVMCQCSQRAILLTVRKEGPNTGRKFYKCGNNQCNFFLWEDSAPNNQSSNRSTNPLHTNDTNHNNPSLPQSSWSYTGSGNADSDVSCTCGESAKRLIVQKEGPNKGRPFFVCAKSVNRCNFFLWADTSDNAESSNSWRANNRGASGSTRPTPYSSENRKKRKCGVCQQEGHTRRNCPNVQGT